MNQISYLPSPCCPPSTRPEKGCAYDCFETRGGFLRTELGWTAALAGARIREHTLLHVYHTYMPIADPQITQEKTHIHTGSMQEKETIMQILLE